MRLNKKMKKFKQNYLNFVKNYKLMKQKRKKPLAYIKVKELKKKKKLRKQPNYNMI